MSLAQGWQENKNEDKNEDEGEGKIEEEKDKEEEDEKARGGRVKRRGTKDIRDGPEGFMLRA